MIVANVRARLTREDVQLALALLARSERDPAEEPESRLREHGINALLDDPRLLGALLSSGLGARASLPFFVYVVARHALLQSGEDDVMLADYAASILLHFGLRGRATRIAEADDEIYDTVVALVAAVDGPDARRTFLVRAHLGNYVLWLAGLYPDFIEHRRWRRGGPDLDYYDEMGRRGFRLAAGHRLANEHGLSPLFARAADRFPVMRAALNRVSDTLLFPNVSSPERVMRQVRDEVRWRVS
ncbi:MAG TPA: hypothetical protein VJL28_11110 [Gemmatimonadaceae bacterium]|nr:hypothetical protein [Gemmatimonadaceae bacterium]